MAQPAPSVASVATAGLSASASANEAEPRLPAHVVLRTEVETRPSSKSHTNVDKRFQQPLSYLVGKTERTGNFCPVHRGFHNGDAQPLRQKYELHIEAPPLQMLIAVERPRRPSCEQLRACTQGTSPHE